MLTAVTSSIVSPYRITTEPSACFATFPVSTISSLSPSLIDSFKYFFFVIYFPQNKKRPSAKVVKPRPPLEFPTVRTFYLLVDLQSLSRSASNNKFFEGTLF